MLFHKKNDRSHRILNGFFFAVLFLIVVNLAPAAFADPVPRLSDKKFQSELIEMTSEYDKDVTPQQAARNPYITERLIVKSSDRRLDPDDYGAIDAIQDREGTYILQFDSSASARRAEKQLQKEETTEYVEPDIMLFATFDDASAVSSQSTSSQWNIDQMGLKQYADSIIAQGKQKSVIVAVLDTGISFTHPMLENRILKDKAASYATDYVKKKEEDYGVLYDNNQLPLCYPDENKVEGSFRISHGTHVAGIIVQCTPGLDVKILPIRVLNSKGSGYLELVCRAIKYAAENGVKVINLSLAGASKETSEALENAIREANDRGAVVVVSSGNGKDEKNKDGVNMVGNGYFMLPGYIDKCVVVGAVDDTKERAPFSNFGETLDVVAPGVGIRSSVITASGNDYGVLSGTSMAAPHVAAEAALLWMENWSATPAEIERKIQSSAEDLGTSGKDDYFGYGLASVHNLLNKYTVTFDPGEYGTFSAVNHTVEFGTNTPAAPAVTGQKGYIFNGWSPGISQTVTGNVVYKAQWKADSQYWAEEARKAQEAARQAQEAARRAEAEAKLRASSPYANVAYLIPLKKNQRTDKLKVLGLTGGDSVVSWTSSDGSKVSVAGNPDGTCVVSAGKKTGNAVITASCLSGKQVIFRIKVQKKKVKTKKIRIGSKTVGMAVGEMVQLNAEPYPITSVDRMKFTSKKPGVVFAAGDGTLTARSKGTAVVVVKSGKKKIKVKVTVY